MGEQLKPPVLADIVQPPGSVYLRKLDRKADWGSDETPPEQRADDAVRLVFHPNTYPYSVYLVRSDEDLHRVIIGMNGGRLSLSSESYYIAIHPDDLAAIAIRADPTPGSGTTRCRFANSLHHDIAADGATMKALCLRLIHASRKVTYISKGRTKLLVPKAETDGCFAAVAESANCRVEICS